MVETPGRERHQVLIPRGGAVPFVTGLLGAVV